MEDRKWPYTGKSIESEAIASSSPVELDAILNPFPQMGAVVNSAKQRPYFEHRANGDNRAVKA